MDVQRQRQPGMVAKWAPTLAVGLGGFSVALGLMELIAPRSLARWLGMEGGEKLLAGYGLREFGTGIGILGARDPAPWIWGRVGGDALDIGTLATGLTEGNRRRANVAIALAAVAGVTALDVVCALALSSRPGSRSPLRRDYSNRRGMPRPPEEMRGAARDFRAPRDMRIPQPLRPYSTG